MVNTNLKKKSTAKIQTKTGKDYSYKYTELADINEYIEGIGETYYQFIDRINNDDYIMTVRQKNGVDSEPKRGCRVIQTISSYNPAQDQGSSLTYARRYSLLMAFGLATKDDDALSLTKPKEEVKKEADKVYALIRKEQYEKIFLNRETDIVKHALSYYNKAIEKLSAIEAAKIIQRLDEKEVKHNDNN